MAVLKMYSICHIFLRTLQDDDEVTKITGGNELKCPDSNRSTRHITPQICVDSSAGTSRAVSRISTASSKAGTTAPTPAPTAAATIAPTAAAAAAAAAASVSTPANSECKSGGLHPPSSSSVNDFVRQVRGRIRYLTVCGSTSSDLAAEVASVVTAINEEASFTAAGASPHHQLKRATSCPDERQIRERLAALKGGQKMDDSATMVKEKRGNTAIASSAVAAATLRGSTESATKSAQTDEFHVFPYEHLFPSVLPQWFVGSQGGAAGQQKPQHQREGDTDMNPYEILDSLINASASKGEPMKLDTYASVRCTFLMSMI